MPKLKESPLPQLFGGTSGGHFSSRGDFLKKKRSFDNLNSSNLSIMIHP